MLKQKVKKSDIPAIMSIPLDYENTKGSMFMHCRDCLDKFLKSPMHEALTPRDWGSYEASSYPFTYPDGTKVGLFVVWCKRCGKAVWDSRHLTPLF